jgi:hypothetical protein
LPSIGAKLMSITCTTPEGLFSTSPSQKRRTLNPRAARNRVRCSSYARWSACWPPSTSTMSLGERQQKSAMYQPTGNWRRNLAPSRDLRLRADQSLRSASVIRRRNSRERSMVFGGVGFQRAFIARRILPLPHLPPQLSGGRDRKELPPHFSGGLCVLAARCSHERPRKNERGQGQKRGFARKRSRRRDEDEAASWMILR